MSKDILRKLKNEEYFFLHDGTVIQSVNDAPAVISKVNEETFRYHVNPETNDFANWIEFLSGDKETGSRIRRCYEREELIKAVRKEIQGAVAIRKAIIKARKAPVKKVAAKPVKMLKAAKKAAAKKAPKKAVKAARPKKAIKAAKAQKTVKPKKAVKPKKVIRPKRAARPKKAAKPKKAVRPARKTRKAASPAKRYPDITAFTDYLSQGIKEYLLGIITGLILGLILGSFF